MKFKQSFNSQWWSTNITVYSYCRVLLTGMDTLESVKMGKIPFLHILNWAE